jgi:hypothetical protein
MDEPTVQSTIASIRFENTSETKRALTKPPYSMRPSKIEEPVCPVAPRRSTFCCDIFPVLFDIHRGVFSVYIAQIQRRGKGGQRGEFCIRDPEP